MEERAIRIFGYGEEQGLFGRFGERSEGSSGEFGVLN